MAESEGGLTIGYKLLNFRLKYANEFASTCVFFFISHNFKQQIRNEPYTINCKQWTDCSLRRSILINDI